MKKYAILIGLIFVILVAVIVFLNKSNEQNGTYFNGHTYLLLDTSFLENFTFVAWVYYKSFNGTGVIASQGISENGHSTWYVGTGGEILNKTVCGIFSDEKVEGNYTVGWRFAVAPFIGIGLWHMVACVYNTTTISIYIDGKLVNKTSTPYKVPTPKIIEVGKRTSTFYINNEPTFAYLNGYLANVQFYNSSLSDDKIYELYKRGLNGEPFSNVSIYLPFKNNFTNGCIEYGKACSISVVSS
jgi:hypothetical protein